MEINKELNTNDLMSIAINIAKQTDSILYANLVYGFGNIKYDLNDSEFMEKVRYIKSNFSIEEIIIEACNRSDYEDLFAFNRSFISDYKDWNPDENIFSWKYNRNNIKYDWIKNLIDDRKSTLSELGLYSINRSNDTKKHNHFIWWMNKFLNGEYASTIHLYECVDTRCTTMFRLAGKRDDSNVYDSIINYILDYNIVPVDNDYLDLPDILDGYNFRSNRVMKASANEGGMWYLVYLTPDDLQKIYKEKINKRTLSYHDKAVWAYINALKCDSAKYRKFYLYFR